MRSPGGLYAKPHPPSLLKFIHLLHLNQARVQDLICDLTDAHPCPTVCITRIGEGCVNCLTCEELVGVTHRR